jgi:hypothetical protein
MKNNPKNQKANMSSEFGGTEAKHSESTPTNTSVPIGSNVTHRETLSKGDGIRIVCFACYLEHAIQGVIQVLQIAGELLKTNGPKADIDEGITSAEQALEELLEELRLKHHGEGLPKGSVPVRPLPVVAPPQSNSAIARS